MQNKRLFFSDPIKALYMAENFEIKMRHKNESCPLSKDYCSYLINRKYTIGKESKERIYIAPESEDIFEPKEDDLILHCSPDTEDDTYKLWKADIGSAWLKKYFKEIIMRDNKAFFSPEVDDEK